MDSADHANKAIKALKKGYNYTILTYAQYKSSLDNVKPQTTAQKNVELINNKKQLSTPTHYNSSPYVWRPQPIANSSNQETQNDINRKRKLQNDK